MQNAMPPNEMYGEFRPETLSRRGEFIAWGSGLLVTGAWILLLLIQAPVYPALSVLAVILVLSGMAISLGNWMDRRTFIRLESEGIHFENGLRRVHLPWNEILQVQMFPSPWGNKICLVGEKGHFAFRTLGEVRVQGEIKGRMGFIDGEKILQQILKKGNLKQVEQSDSGLYYVRM